MDSTLESIRSSILTILERGPALTIDVSEAIEKDTTQAAAILDFYVGQSGISKTERRYGTSAIYYLDKDIDAALAKLFSTLNENEKRLVDKIKSQKLVKTEDLTPAERYISKNLNDFLKTVAAKDSETGKRVDYIYYYSLSLDDVKKILNGESSETTEVSAEESPKEQKTIETEEKSPSKKRRRKQKLSEPISEEVKNMLFSRGFSGVKRVEPDVYTCDYGQNRLNTVVIISTKPSITKKDLIKFAGYAASYKTVVFIITSAKRVADSSEYGSTINIIRI